MNTFLSIATVATALLLPITEVAGVFNNAWIDLQEDTNYVARHECSFVQAGDKFYMFGGREQATRLDRYDYATNTWDQAVAAAPVELNHFQAIEYQGLIWVISAFSTNNYPDEVPATNIYVYDPAHDIWMKGAEIPANRRRGGAGVVMHDNTFWIVGGNTRGHNGGAVSWVDQYNPHTNQWSISPDAPRARDHFAAVLVQDKMYSVGGRFTDQPNGPFDRTISEIDVFDIPSKQWSTLNQRLPSPRAAASVVYFEGKILVMGGESDAQQAAFSRVDAIELHNNNNAIIRRVASMNYPRHGTQAIVSGGGVFIAGGSPTQGGGQQRNMEVYSANEPEAGEASSKGILQGPKAPQVSINRNGLNTVEMEIRHTSGNTGVFVQRMFLDGPGANRFRLLNESSESFVIRRNDQHKVSIEYTGEASGITATFHMIYSNNQEIVIHLMGSSCSSCGSTTA